MKRVRPILSLLIISMTATLCSAQDEYNIFFLTRDANAYSEGTQAQIDYFEGRGDIGFIDIWDNTRVRDETAWLDLDPLIWADASDLVWVDESVSSSRLAPIADTETPIINNENYGCDSLGMLDPTGDDDHGSPGSPNAEGVEISAGTHFGTDILIVDDTHPIAVGAGLSNGVHTIYDDLGLGAAGGGRMSWCMPNEEAEIVALIPGYEDEFPTASPIFVHEQGDIMADGREAPGLRVQFFLSDTNRGPAPEGEPRGGADGSGPGWEATLLTDEGYALFDSVVNFALGIEPATTPMLAGDANGDGIVNATDLNIVGGNWQMNVDPPGPENGDFNNDGFVDAADLNVVGSNWQQTAAAPANAAVPEPSGLCLFGIGILALGRLRRRS